MMCILTLFYLVTYSVLFQIVTIILFDVFVAFNSTSSTPNGEKRWNVGIIILITVLSSTVLIIGGVAACRFWQKKKREQEQAQFLKLFEDGDDIEDELSFGM